MSSAVPSSSSRTTRKHDARRVALAGQHPGQPADRDVAVEARDGAQLAAHQRPGGLDLVVGVDLVEGAAGHLVVDALAAQLLGQRPAGQALAGLPGLHPGARERRVVDQADLLEPVEQPARRRSSGTLFFASLPRSSARLRACPVSWSSRILRATASWSASGPASPDRRRPGPLGGRGPDAAAVCRRATAAAQKSIPVGSTGTAASSAGASTVGPTPSFSRICFSSSLARSGLSRRKVREFSLPWPSWSPS